MDNLDYAIGTRVRLVLEFCGLISGSEGVVIGFYRTDPPAYAVSIGERSVPIPPEYVIAVEPETR